MTDQITDKIPRSLPEELKLPSIVFLDVDGTILNSKHEMPQLTRDAVAKLQSLGVEVVLATGRGTFD